MNTFNAVYNNNANVVPSSGLLWHIQFSSSYTYFKKLANAFFAVCQKCAAVVLDAIIY